MSIAKKLRFLPGGWFGWRFAPAVLLALVLGAAHAAATAPAVRSEIEALMAVLRTSDCRFNRNGSWHDGAAASAHLLGKLDYLERRGQVESTERFIELAASASSASGKAYAVQCGGAPAQPSRDWLLAQLRALRTPAAR
ncbi:MAG: DUF5329 family protein [Rhodocyclaceae bacterium]|nr:DUF5329 family protein [Rhodocyclaceae bacterium]MBX3670896.1 DUF5329 family protein [Rhodocyclaceae bacterium]